MSTHPITPDRAQAIRDRFTRAAADHRADADRAEAAGDPATADLLRRAAESVERMAEKRYEAMRTVGEA